MGERSSVTRRQDEETHESLSSLHRVWDPGRGATGIVDRLGLVAHARGFYCPSGL